MSREYYSYKVTTNGSSLLAACLDLGRGLELTRVVMGSGMVPDDVELWDVHSLYNYVADGSIGGRSREGDHLNLTIQYNNGDEGNRDIPMFYLSEFMVYARHPETGEETDLLYATLGDYRQPVPAYRDDLPVCVYDFPLTMVVSGEIDVSVTTSAGLLTFDDIDRMRQSGALTSREDVENEVARHNADPDAHPDFYVDEDTIRKIVNGTYVPGEHEDDIADNADVQEILDDMYRVPAPPVEDDGDDTTASGQDLEDILDGLYAD